MGGRQQDLRAAVQTAAGTVRGRWEDGVAVYRGIPFAAPPVWPLRFAAPRDLGLHPAVVADKLGHTDPNFTIKRYIGVRGNADIAAMAVTDAW